MTAAQELTSVGVLASHLQVPVQQIEVAARNLGIEPALRLNTVAHYDRDQIERIVQAIATQRMQFDPVAQRRNIR